ncbi:MAG TPA: cyanophycinase [Candidatus Levybacteria bacterium]|nr:cyanophycinase [Candidatus Levybacteria bacterium]
MQTLERPRFSDQSESFPQSEGVKNRLRGTLIIIGGGAKEASLQAVADHLPVPKHLTVTTLASPSDPEYQYGKCRDGMEKLGVTVSYLTNKKIEEEHEAYLTSETSGLFVTGGYQDLLMRRLNASRFSRELREYHTNGGTVIGTSAGASFMGGIMPLRDTYEEGFGFIPHIIDQHFSQKNRKSRLARLVAEFPDRIGIGIDENTAVVYHHTHMQVMGEGQVYVLESNGSSRLQEVVLRDGDVFDLSYYSSYTEAAAD